MIVSRLVDRAGSTRSRIKMDDDPELGSQTMKKNPGSHFPFENLDSSSSVITLLIAPRTTRTSGNNDAKCSRQIVVRARGKVQGVGGAAVGIASSESDRPKLIDDNRHSGPPC